MVEIVAPLSLILLAPLCGAMLTYVIGVKRENWAGWIASLSALGSFLLTIMFFMRLEPDGKFIDTLFTWFAVKGISIDFKLQFDALTAVMCLVVTGVGSLIHFYSIGYMAEDSSRPRFFAYLNLFMFSMLLLVLGGNLLILFIGWEGVGLCSYLLIGFWHKNPAYAAAGRKAFVVNRIGDAGFLLGIFLLVMHLGTVDFSQLETAIRAGAGSGELMTLVAFCLFVGATGKSAQIPLFVWLPDAMAGPTPVSALIHAATMVTAGVYLLARLNFLFDLAPGALAVVAVVAAITSLVAAVIALTQFDIKKVLAYSTVSQLGFMFMAASAGAYWVAIFHVITHAFFKACLFLGAGSVIHGCHHEQDMREMGGLAGLMKLTFLTYAISTLAIAGIFPFAGYQSKHAILGALEHGHGGAFVFALWTAKVVAVLTAFYMTRSVMMTFFGKYRGHAHPHESPAIMVIPLLVLATLATVGGLYLAHHLPEYLSAVLPIHAAHHAESVVASVIHSWPGLLGVAVAVLLYGVWQDVPGKIFSALKPVGTLSRGKFFVDELYQLLVVSPLERMAAFLWRIVDQGMIDGAVNGTAELVEVNGRVVRQPQTGQLRHYAMYMLLATIALLLFCFVL